MSQELVPLGTNGLSKDDQIARAEEIEREMNADLKKVLESVRGWLAKNVTGNLKRIWALGRAVKRVHTKTHKYGARAVERLAAVLVYDKRLLHKAMQFYEAFPLKDLEDLLSHRMRVTKEPVTYVHIEQLLRIGDVAARKKMLKQCVENNWTPEELSYYVSVSLRQLSGKPTETHAGGRPVKVPTTIVQLLHNFEKASGTLVRNDPLMYTHPMINFVRYAADLPADKITPELLAKMDECIGNLDSAMMVLAKVKPQLLEAKVKAEQKMAAQSADQGVIDAEIISTESKKEESPKKRLTQRAAKT
jgi:hypothetical protein